MVRERCPVPYRGERGVPFGVPPFFLMPVGVGNVLSVDPAELLYGIQQRSVVFQRHVLCNRIA